MKKPGMIGAMVGLLAVVAVASLALRSDRAEQIEALEHRIEELEHRVMGLGVKPVDADLTTRVAVLEGGFVERQIANESDPSEPETIDPEVMSRLQHVEHAVAETDRTLSKTIDARVEEAVDEKISKLEKKQNMKPSLADFADVLELDENQQSVVENVIWLGQDAVRAVLETPTADGTILIDGLVEALAYGEVKHPEAAQIFMEWVGQVMNTKIPGSEYTYGWRVEATKNDVRAALRRELTDEQYAEFERWNVDPTEIQEIEDSPWSDIGVRIAQRALELTQ